MRTFIFKAGVKRKNKLVLSKFDFLKQSEKWSINQLKDYQFERAKSLISYAYENSEYIKKKYQENNVSPEDFQQLTDLKKFPILTKQELLDFNDTIHTTKDKQGLISSQTSGTSGQRLNFYRNKEWDAIHRASIYRGYSWYGVNPWDRSGYVHNFSFERKHQIKTWLLDSLLNRFRLFYFQESQLNSFLKKLEKADFLQGYSSLIYELAKVINDRGIQENYQLKMVKGTSEQIHDIYQPEVQKAFGQRMISEYGSAEAGIISFECPYGNQHITMENVIVEEVDGEIVVTNLSSFSFPIIRYKQGDSISLLEKTDCPCGMQHYIIDELKGRTGKWIYGKEKNYPVIALMTIFKNLNVYKKMPLHFQGKQLRKGELEILIEQTLSAEEKRIVEEEISRYFDLDDMKVTMKDSVTIPKGNGKFKDFISELN
ncbi:phenylacetate--CoA ligase family protein [Bacillus marinisedimentorum]|uniref:phenylacetate--CoA ligase family protein n=1 Tax=Bacillus marinisedimentorum TaxID=1821260 RepID=UPI0007DE8EA5|nr:phenylacetate--CoA ligase family protein [Bacillus marinisedimentorum]